MHELAIAEQILRTALPAAEKAGAKRILRFGLSIGALSGVVPSFLDTAMKQAAKGTIAEGAVIDAVYVPPELHCEDCGADSAGERGRYVCPRCGSERIRLTKGSGYVLEELTVE